MLLYYTLTPLLAEGASDQSVIEALIEQNDPELDEVLATNSHLTADQITRLLDRTEELQRSNKGPNYRTAILLASRYDLTLDHIWSIISGKSVLARQAFIDKPTDYRRPIEPKLFEYILDATWFTEDYGHELLNGSFSLTDEQNAMLRPYQHNLGFLAFLERQNGKHEYPKNRAYKARSAVISNVRECSKVKYTDGQLTQIDRSTAQRLASSMNLPKEVLERNLNTYPVDRLAARVQKTVGSAGKSYYELFFELLPSWEGSIKELATATKTILTAK